MSAEPEPHWPKKTGPSTTTFCERHGLIPELVPFGHWSYDPWEIVIEADRELRALPKTAATFTSTGLFDDPEVNNRYWLDAARTAFLLLGAWPMDDSQRANSRWVNPHYIHERALPPADADRKSHILACADLGVFKQSDLAPRFDLTEGSLRTWLSRKGIPWEKRRQRGERQLARTLVTASEWLDCPRSKLTDRLPVSRQTVYFWVREHVRESEWSIPADRSRTGGVDA